MIQLLVATVVAVTNEFGAVNVGANAAAAIERVPLKTGWRVVRRTTPQSPSIVPTNRARRRPGAGRGECEDSLMRGVFLV